MTMKEYNSIFHAAFEAACKVDEVREILKSSHVAFIYDVEDYDTGLHKIITVSRRSQMNDETLRKYGFNPRSAHVELVAEFLKPAKMMYIR